jgi:hypothetical protein
MVMKSPDNIIQLPLSVVGRVDVGRLLREIEALDNYLTTEAVRAPGAQPRLPKTSQLLEELRVQNKINILKETERLKLRNFLESARTEAPVLHMSFSTDPSPLFVRNLIKWLRREIHPLTLLQVGLQPTIGAGAVVRTTNRQFDLSLRQKFTEKRDVLIKRIRQLEKDVNVAQNPPPEVVR